MSTAKKGNREPLTLRLDPDIKESLRTLAFHKRSTVTQLIRDAIVDYLNRQDDNE